MRERSSIDIFTPQNDVLGCRTKGFISWESTFTFILVDNSAFPSEEDYSVTIVNTPSLQKLSMFLKKSSPNIHSRISSVQAGFWEFSSRFWELQLVIIYNFMFWENFMSGSHKTPIPGVTNLQFVLRRCPLLFIHWLGYCKIALLQKNQQTGPVNAPKKVLWCFFQIEDFLFLPTDSLIVLKK